MKSDNLIQSLLFERKRRRVAISRDNDTWIRRSNRYSNLANKYGELDIDSTERILGPKKASAQRELRVSTLLPLLAHRSKAGDFRYNLASDFTRIPRNKEEEEAHREYNRLLDIETDHIHKRVMKVSDQVEKDAGGHSIYGFRSYKPSNTNPDIEDHDAWDHGHTGTTPSDIGEIEAEHFDNLYRKIQPGMSRTDRATWSKQILRKSLHSLFSESMKKHVKSRKDWDVIPHETLMSWSKAMNPR